MLSCCLWWLPDLFQMQEASCGIVGSLCARRRVCQHVHTSKIFIVALKFLLRRRLSGGTAFLLGCQLALFAARSGHLDSWRGAAESPQSP